MSDTYTSTPWGLYPDDGFAAGTVVALVSGGPALTVVGTHRGYTLVQWFAEDELRAAAFPADAIYSIDEDDFEDTIGVCAGTA